MALNAGVFLCFVCRLCYVNSLADHEGPVTVVATSPTLGDIATVCSRKSHKYTSKYITLGTYMCVLHAHVSKHYHCTREQHYPPFNHFIESSSDEACVLPMWTINGKLIGRATSKVQIHCLQYTSAPEGVYVNVLVGGLANGNIVTGSSPTCSSDACTCTCTCTCSSCLLSEKCSLQV